MKNNVCDNLSFHSCTGCGICAAVCGKKAISIILDNHGFYKPVVDDDRCVECGLCKISCYKYDKELVQTNTVEKTYAATNKDRAQLFRSSSGGVSRLLMEECIKNGYKIFGCSYDIKKEYAKSFVVATIDELDLFYGSKYFQSYTVDGFTEVLKDGTDQKYAIFGTPCQIYAFTKTRAYKRFPEKYFMVDIFCHGCPSMKLWKSYLSYVKRKTSCENFDGIAFRSKIHGWHEYSFEFYKNDKKYISNKHRNLFYEIFFSQDIMNKACYDCNSRSTMGYGDIRLGDFWGPQYDTDTKGVSAVIIKTAKGAEIFNTIKNKLHVEDTTLEKILISQSYGKKYVFNQKRRDFLLSNLTESVDLKSLADKYRKMFPLKRRMKSVFKSLIKYFPTKIYFYLKKILHSI